MKIAYRQKREGFSCRQLKLALSVDIPSVEAANRLGDET